ncbi:hypothetical protein M011DRAFT_403471 [Sporormia fimetaria CBS 119925]|uniref:Uncharacterized protein n=1 Tax=Sporormia fimetaria CBS 119925 TaxID=1340428 RepID=A0A6A6VCY9_9PLEO|nr:hypothetical protein M011DRAFT_403471 [Sporormia fimetaria CBS 119925]
MGFFEKLQARLELYRLEQRYTRRDKRTTFYSDAQYVDGEYVYATSPTSSTKSASTNNTANSRHGGRSATSRLKDLTRAGSRRP